MLHEIDVLYLLKESADNYISSLNGRGFDWTEYEGQINAYLKVLDDKDVKVSKIATGVPIGTDMEYIDSLTLELAIDERKNMS